MTIDVTFRLLEDFGSQTCVGKTGIGNIGCSGIATHQALVKGKPVNLFCCNNPRCMTKAADEAKQMARR